MNIKTAKLGADFLKKLGYDVKVNVGKTGVYADLKKGDSNKIIMVRGDMDALTIQENTGLEFSSINKGIMHACGHDSHVAMVLGCAKLLTTENFNGTVRIVLQPSEEIADEEYKSGALRMIEDGVLEGVTAGIGLHVDPKLTTGKISINHGYINASADEFKIYVTGKSAHAGVEPQKGVDAIVISAQIINAVQTLVARNTAPQDCAVVSIGKIVGGDAQNIVSKSVFMHGTMRTLNNELRDKLTNMLESIVTNCALMNGGSAKVKWVSSYPANFNNEKLTNFVIENSANAIFGKKNIVTKARSMGGEDFSIFSQHIPTFFAHLGAKPAGAEPTNLHCDNMMLDESSFAYGSALFTQIVVDYLK